MVVELLLSNLEILRVVVLCHRVVIALISLDKKGLDSGSDKLSNNILSEAKPSVFLI
jgi:hypothetical protein